MAKLQNLQQNYADLAEREAKLSYAKIELSKERVKLQNLQSQLRRSKCSLCRIGEQSKEIIESDPLADIIGGGNADEPQMNSSGSGLETMKFGNADHFQRSVPSVDELLNAEPKFNSCVPNILMASRQFDFGSDRLPFRDMGDFNGIDSDLRLVNLNLMNAKHADFFGSVDLSKP